ncbi:MAG: hypothetical protein ACREYC_20520 [Gammaproteobacteria bacterium]
MLTAKRAREGFDRRIVNVKPLMVCKASRKPAPYKVAAGALALWLAPGLLPAQDAKTVQQQLEEQKATNEALRARIAKLEEVLKSDVCANPEAATLLGEESAAPPAAP